MLRIVIFDVSNGSCALAVDHKGHSLMLDCGSHSSKPCPVDRILELRKQGCWLEHMRDFEFYSSSYPLTKLAVSHPDLDHIKNAKKVYTKLTPYILSRRRLEEFPAHLLPSNDPDFHDYKSLLCSQYWPEFSPIPDWGFRQTCYFIPTKILKEDQRFEESSFKNNSSYVYLIEHEGYKFLFSGDMEQAGWEWLLENNSEFLKDISTGMSVLIASHHGHKSGYSQSLMNKMEGPLLSVLSKGKEIGGNTDVESRYSTESKGMLVKNMTTKQHNTKYSLTTRSNGALFFEVNRHGLLAYSER